MMHRRLVGSNSYWVITLVAIIGGILWGDMQLWMVWSCVGCYVVGYQLLFHIVSFMIKWLEQCSLK